MSQAADFEQVNIVLLGSFNPAIFQPAWFAAQGLIPCDEEKVPLGVKGIAHPDITDFTTGDFHLQVVRDRMSIRALTAAFNLPLRDLVLGTFQILRHTPMGNMGLNREMHFRLPDEAAWHAVGDRLAPKGSWQGVMEEPGMLQVHMQGKRPGERPGFLRVKIEPSSRVKPYGIMVEVNDHYEVPGAEGDNGCADQMGILRECWEESIERAEKIARTVIFGEQE